MNSSRAARRVDLLEAHRATTDHGVETTATGPCATQAPLRLQVGEQD